MVEDKIEDKSVLDKLLVLFFVIIAILGIILSSAFLILGAINIHITITELVSTLREGRQIPFVYVATDFITGLAFIIISIGTLNTFFKQKIVELEDIHKTKLPFKEIYGFQTLEKTVIDTLVTMALLVIILNLINYNGDVLHQSISFMAILLGLSIYLYVSSRTRD